MRESAQISVIKPGWFTTVQDLGRVGFQQFGMPVSGAMDRRSLIIANRLVGNRDQDAALEVTFKGPELLFNIDTEFAIAGADLSPFINGRPIPAWTTVEIRTGDRLSFGARRNGARCYLAVTGGFIVPEVLGSRSTHVASKTGGMEGRALIAGDILMSGLPITLRKQYRNRIFPANLRPIYSTFQELRIISGPQPEAFSSDAFATLTSSTYRISGHSDRMGYRLEGPILGCRGKPPSISDGTAMGVLQVPADGQPILLMADRHTTGGYPKIGVVITADLHLAAQLLPGETIRFARTTFVKAQQAMKSQWEELERALPPTKVNAPLSK